MVNKFDNETHIDLRKRPKKHTHKITQFTEGDLHANVIKLIYTLIRNGVCQLSDKSYTELVQIYESKPPLNQQQLLRFNEIIEHDLQVIDPTILVRLIGDILADRGRNDYLVLKVLRKLRRANVPLRILMSNHDNVFLEAIGLFGQPLQTTTGLLCEDLWSLRCKLSWQTKIPQVADFASQIRPEYIFTDNGLYYYDPWDNSVQLISTNPATLHELRTWLHPNINIDFLTDKQAELIREQTGHQYGVSQARSYIELQRAITSGLIDRQEVNEMLQEAYLPQLMLLDYTYHNGVLTIISHAPIDLQNIEAVAQQFEVPYDGSIVGLMQTINAINKEFRYAVESNLTQQVLAPGTAAYQLLWQREDELFKARHHCETRHLPNIKFMYGHDKQWPESHTPKNIIRVDNILGKNGLMNHHETNISYISTDPIAYNSIELNQDRTNKSYIKQAKSMLLLSKGDLQHRQKELEAELNTGRFEPQHIKHQITELNNAIDAIIYRFADLGEPIILPLPGLLNKLTPLTDLKPVRRLQLLKYDVYTEEFKEAIKLIELKDAARWEEIECILQPYLLKVPVDLKIIILAKHLKNLAAPDPMVESTSPSTTSPTSPATSKKNSTTASKSTRKPTSKKNPNWAFLLQFMAHPYTRRVLTICILVGFAAALLSLGALTGPAGWANVAKVCAGLLHTSPMVLGISGASITVSTGALRAGSLFACYLEEKQASQASAKLTHSRRTPQK